MEIETKLMVYGFLSLLVSLFAYFTSVSGKTPSISYTIFLFIAGNSVWLIMTGILIKWKYYNTIYLISSTIILLVVITLIFNQTISPEYSGTKMYSYVLAVIFFLTNVYATYGIVRWKNLYKNTTTAYEKVLLENPKDIVALNNKGAALAERKFNNKALECFEKVIEIDPMDAAAWHNKGVVLDSFGRHQEAIKCYDKALRLDPKFENAKKTGKIILES